MAGDARKWTKLRAILKLEPKRPQSSARIYLFPLYVVTPYLGKLMESFVYLHAYCAYQSPTERDRAIAQDVLQLFQLEQLPGQKLVPKLRVSVLAVLTIVAIFGMAGEALAQRILQRGMSGSDVGIIQEQLFRAGFDPNGIDNIFGRDTERAVKQFQRAHGLFPNGEVDPRTRSVLRGYTQPLTNVSSRTFWEQDIPPDPRIYDTPNSSYATNTSGRSELRRGDRGEAVRQLQRELRRRNFYFDEIDGVYGQNTQSAVASFQWTQRLPASGIADRETLAALNISLEADGNRYVVVVPGDSRQLLQQVRESGVREASPANDRRGPYIRAGRFSSRAEAESLSYRLRSRGLDARVAFF